MQNDPAERCAKAIADGRYATELEWCRAVAASDDARVPQEWRKWALERIAAERPANDPRNWARVLKARFERGDKLLECQLRAFRQVLGDERKTATPEG